MSYNCRLFLPCDYAHASSPVRQLPSRKNRVLSDGQTVTNVIAGFTMSVYIWAAGHQRTLYVLVASDVRVNAVTFIGTAAVIICTILVNVRKR